ncbi:MAG: beta-ketoacyl-ACP synthase II [Candidatus Omnitrophica bacterium]|nr:beta-ketoacyl-ACP synthase II [Candidatus Omnitrophota bacterium]
MKKSSVKKNNRVVITGIGAVAPNGIGKDNFWQANVNGISGIDYTRTFDVDNFDTKIVGAVKNFNASRYIDETSVRKLDRFAQFGVAASKMALKDGSLKLSNLDPKRIGVCVGSGLGGILFHEEQIVDLLKRKLKKPNPLAVVKIMPNSVSAHISIKLKIKGPNLSISTACSSGLQAIGSAFDLIRDARADIMIAGGTEAPLTFFTFNAFNSMRVMTQRNNPPDKASCPFDKNRDGFVLSEGAGFIILESLKMAQKRNANIYAEVLGFGNNSSAYHIVMPQPDGKDIEKTMHLALEDADIKPKDVDYINAHGTSTLSNDRAETLAIKNLFGRHAYKLAISSTKSMIGHNIGAAGALGTIIGALTIKNNLIPPTINYKNFDPDCDLNYVPNKACDKKINVALINAFGFGGSNASLVLGDANLR